MALTFGIQTIGSDIGSQSICADYRYGRNYHIGNRSDHRSDYASLAQSS